MDQDIIIEQINNNLINIVKNLNNIKELTKLLNIPGIVSVTVNNQNLNNEDLEYFNKIVELINTNELLVKLEELGLNVNLF